MNSPVKLNEMKADNGLVPQQQARDQQVDFFSKNGFELACRIAKAFSTSDAVPAAFRAQNEKKAGGNVTVVDNPAAMGNCLVAIEVSKSVGLSVTAVMQNADVIEGKLRWSAKFQIAAVNASRRFSPLRFKLANLGRIKATYKEKIGWNKQKNGYDFAEREVELDNWECTAWAYVMDARGNPTQEIVQSIPVSMRLAVEEGWYAKSGSKWQTEFRFQMLQYRAGTYFANIYAPDVVMGMGRSSEEIYDNVIDAVQMPNGSFEATPATLQELRTGSDSASPEAKGESAEQAATGTGEITQPNSTAGSSAQTSQGGEGAASFNPSTDAYTKLADRFHKATDVDVLDADATLIAEIGDEAQQEELRTLYKKRRAELSGDAPKATRTRRERSGAGME